MAELNKYLVEINKTVTDWLKFAEAKNAVLLTGNLAIIFGASKIPLFSEASICSLAWFYFLSIALFCGLSAICCLLAIIPQIKIPFFFPKHGASTSDNLVFYGTISTHTPASYTDALQKALGDEFNSVDRSIAGQIVINSQIANRKFIFFKVASWLTLSAFLTPIISLLLVVSCKE